jgi:hypothetical protein
VTHAGVHSYRDIDDGLVDAIAERVADLLEERAVGAAAPASWLDAEAVARLLNVERSYVYEHATVLGARRLGDGPRARLRFRLEDVERAIPCVASRRSGEAETRAAMPIRRRRRPAGMGTGVPLLPIRGSDSA